MFKCPLCGTNHDNEYWNKATREIFGDVIYTVEEEPDMQGSYYVCPTCREEIMGDSLIKSK